MLDLNRLCLGCMNELEEENRICKICGWNSEADENSPHQLKCGTVLQGKYLVGKVLGEGGFGITYLGYNLILQEKVAIKEFYPHGFVGRDTTVNSTVMSYVGQESFTEKSKNGFIREAKTMQSLNKVEGIVEMKDVFAENNTVYIVMEYVEGQTLKEYVKENGNKLPMSTVLELLEPVMDALEQIHAHNLIHRDISPDNIMVGPDGKVTLLDLGAARQISADGGHSLTVNVKHGYAPMEQYQTHGEQGPWTDIYALCATIYRLITGKVPPSAADRAFDDKMERPMMLGADITEEQERILLKGLAPRSGDRYLNMFELRDAFKYTEKNDIVEKEIVNMEPLVEEKVVQQESDFSGYDKEDEAVEVHQEDLDVKNNNRNLNETIEKIKKIKNEEKRKEIRRSFVILFSVVIVLVFVIVVPGSEAKYREGQEYYNRGTLDLAYEIFDTIRFYKESKQYCESIENSYEEAISQFNEKQYAYAALSFKTLGSYKDSEARYKESCYQNAMRFFEAEQYLVAREIFIQIGRAYRNVSAMINKCDEGIVSQRYNKFLSDIEDAETGDIVYFGEYDQDENFENGKEPISWIVLEKENGRAMLLSEFVMDSKQYSKSGIYCSDGTKFVDWESSYIRGYLSHFYILCFSQEEKDSIVLSSRNTPVINGLLGGTVTTEDKMLLLTSNQVSFYLKNTEWLVAKDIITGETTSYWLRNTGKVADKDIIMAEIVDSMGNIQEKNITETCGVRPVIYVNYN